MIGKFIRLLLFLAILTLLWWVLWGKKDVNSTAFDAPKTSFAQDFVGFFDRNRQKLDVSVDDEAKAILEAENGGLKPSHEVIDLKDKNASKLTETTLKPKDASSVGLGDFQKGFVQGLLETEKETITLPITNVNTVSDYAYDFSAKGLLESIESPASMVDSTSYEVLEPVEPQMVQIYIYADEIDFRNSRDLTAGPIQLVVRNDGFFTQKFGIEGVLEEGKVLRHEVKTINLNLSPGRYKIMNRNPKYKTWEYLVVN